MAMSIENRAHIELTLKDAPFPDGEIPLASIAEIARRTQQLVHRLARSLTDRSGRGRSPNVLEQATVLMLTGVRRGSTVLEIAGPAMQAELDLSDVPRDVGTQAIDAFVEGIDAVAHGRGLPDSFDELSREAFAEWFEPLEVANELRVSASLNGKTRSTSVVPKGARAQLVQSLSRTSVADRPDVRAVEGTLYSLNLHTGHYMIEDDAGNSISVRVSLPPDQVRPLVGRRVQASGPGTVDAKGHLTLEAENLSPAPTDEGLDSDEFFAVTDLATLIGDAEPLRAMEELAIEDLTDEEAESFLRGLSEG